MTYLVPGGSQGCLINTRYSRQMWMIWSDDLRTYRMRNCNSVDFSSENGVADTIPSENCHKKAVVL